MNTKNDDYIMGRTSEEYQRLRAQAKLWEFATQRVLRDAGLREGMHCLDMGCGPGEVMRLMGETAGLTGHVTGVDVDGKLGHETLGVLEATTKSRFAFIETDVETAEDIPGAPFDMTFTRITLMHLQDPVTALGKMLRWTKPGGVIVVQEYDFRTWDPYPVHAAAMEAIQVYLKVMEKGGRDACLGAKLPIHFVEAGIGKPDGTDVAGFLDPGFKVSGEITKAVYNSVFPIARQLGVTDDERRKRVFAAIDETIQAGTHTMLAPLLVSAWKRKSL